MAWRFFRQWIWDRDGGICGICTEPVDLAGMDIDHITPKAAGGSDDLDNLRASHASCNRRRPRWYPGMPKKPPRIRGIPITIALPLDLHAQLYAWAREEERSLSQMITYLLRRALAERDRVAA